MFGEGQGRPAMESGFHIIEGQPFPLCQNHELSAMHQRILGMHSNRSKKKLWIIDGECPDFEGFSLRYLSMQFT